MNEKIPDKDLFMMCNELNLNALSDLPKGFYVRNIYKNELDIWKAMPFDKPNTAKKYYEYMTQFYNSVYAKKGALFFNKCLFVCNQSDQVIGTGFIWKSYEKINTVHWFKVLKDYEGKGIGRALLSIIMQNLNKDEYPVFLHTQPASYQAIKLYSDFGFHLLSDPIIGNRKNDLEECLPILKKHMFLQAYKNLKITNAPLFFLDIVSSSSATCEF